MGLLLNHMPTYHQQKEKEKQINISLKHRGGSRRWGNWCFSCLPSLMLINVGCSWKQPLSHLAFAVAMDLCPIVIMRQTLAMSHCTGEDTWGSVQIICYCASSVGWGVNSIWVQEAINGSKNMLSWAATPCPLFPLFSELPAPLRCL